MRYWYTESESMANDLEKIVDRLEFDDQEIKQYQQDKGINRK